MRALSLTDAQMTLIRQSAKPLPIEWRSRFIEACADRLLPLDAITDNAVAEAVNHVLAQMHIPAIEPSCVGDRV